MKDKSERNITLELDPEDEAKVDELLDMNDQILNYKKYRWKLIYNQSQNDLVKRRGQRYLKNTIGEN